MAIPRACLLLAATLACAGCPSGGANTGGQTKSRSAAPATALRFGYLHPPTLEIA